MIVKAEKIHRAFVLSTWVRSYVDATPLDKSIVLKSEPRRAEIAFDTGSVWVDTSDGYTVNGWVCGVRGAFVSNGSKYATEEEAEDHNDRYCMTHSGEWRDGLLHWVYVPPELRNLGMGTKLILETVGSNPEVTSQCRKKRSSAHKTSLPLGRFNPYRMWEF